MKTKYIYSLIIIGLLILPISTIVQSKTTESSYNQRCKDWGNKYNGGSMIVTTYQSKGMSFGQMFRCNGNKTVNTITLHFSSVTGWALPAYKLNVSVRFIDNDTGLPLGRYITGNVSQKPLNGWNTFVFPSSFTLKNNSYYAITCLDIFPIMATTVNVKVKLVSDGKSEILGRSPGGYYEPFDRSFTISKPSSPVVYTEGSMPWAVYMNTSGTITNLEGNALDSLTGDELFVGYRNRQSFYPDYNFSSNSITTPLGVFDQTDYVPDGNAYVNVTDSSGTLLAHGTLMSRYDIGMYSSDRVAYRYYTAYFSTSVSFTKNTKYYFFVYCDWNRGGEMLVPRLTTTNTKLYSLTYQNTTSNASYDFEGGGWSYYPNHDMIFTFSVMPSFSFLICNSTVLTIIENALNCTINHTEYYNSSTGWLQYINSTGNCSIDSDRYFDLMGVLTFDNTQFFLAILIGLWCFFIVEYYNHKEILFAYIQLLFAFPLTLYLAGITFFMSQYLILPVVFIIPILAIYIVADGLYYRRNKK